MSALKSFFISIFVILGITVGLFIVGLAYYGLYSLSEEETYSSKVKLLPDAEGKRAKLSSEAPVLLQINIEGEIGADKMTGKEMEELLLDSREDIFKERPVRGILLHINSPGGSVNDSSIIYHLIKRYKERYGVPVYAYVDGLCASGGYYIACAADKIYASDVSLVGSIGVIAWPPFMNVVDVMEKIGVSSLTVSAGKGKDEMNPFRKWKPDEQEDYQSLINFFYEQFVEIVTANRPISKETLQEKLGAKVLPATQAASIGLIDLCCIGRHEALSALAQAAHIEEPYQVVSFKTTTWWETLLKEEPTTPLITGKIKHELALPTHHGNPFSYIFVP